MSTTTWPTGVMARYVTLAAVVDSAATVDVGTLTTGDGDPYSTYSTCRGCGALDYYDYDRYQYRGYSSEDARELASQDEARGWAQSHAETCRALPAPGGAR